MMAIAPPALSVSTLEEARTPAPSTQAASVATLYRQMWAYAAGARGALVLSSAMLVASQLVKLMVPWLTAQAIDTLQRGRPGAAAACLPWVGGIISGSSDAYAYLPASIRKFPNAQGLAAKMREAGFQDVEFERMTFGAVALHVGRRG